MQPTACSRRMQTMADCRRLMQTKAGFVLQWDIRSLVGGNCLVRAPQKEAQTGSLNPSKNVPGYPITGAASETGTPKTAPQDPQDDKSTGFIWAVLRSNCICLPAQLIGPYWDNKCKQMPRTLQTNADYRRLLQTNAANVQDVRSLAPGSGL